MHNDNKHRHSYIHTYIHTYIYIYIYACKPTYTYTYIASHHNTFNYITYPWNRLITIVIQRLYSVSVSVI